MKRVSVHSALFLGVALVVSGYQALAGVPEDSEARSELYQSLYPLYAEYCAHSQIREKPGTSGDTVTGNEYGHMTLYLNGACLDTSLGYPQIRACDSTDVKPGVGISTDYDYKNVNWVAVPDRHFFYWGDLQPGERFTQAVYERTKARAQAMGILNGVTGEDSLYANKPAGMSNEEFLREDVFGTDFAINVARSSACARLPITHDMLDRMVSFLNGINQAAQADGNQFSSLYNNCTHTSHNAVAATGFWDALNVKAFFPVSIFNIALPFNDFVPFMKQGNDLSLEDPVSAYQDQEIRQLMETSHSFPTRHGVVAETWPAYADNDVYDTTTKPEFVKLPNLFIESSYDDYVSEPRYTDIRANLESFRVLYEEAKKKKPDVTFDPSIPKDQQFDSEQYGKFYNQYYQWLDAQIADVAQKLSILTDK